MILSILPPHNYYTKLSIKADKICVRQMSQIDKQIQKDYKYVLFDKYIPKSLAQKYNKISYNELPRHAINKNGIDCTNYKGISLADLNVVETVQIAFIPCYREALGFISIVKKVNPTYIIISPDDPSIDIFKEISEQMGVQIDFCSSFGEVDDAKTDLIRKSYSIARDADYHGSLNQPRYIEIIVQLINIWSKFIRIIRGRRPFIGLSFYNPLKPIKSKLFFQKKYYPLLFGLIRLKLSELLFSGVHIFSMKDLSYRSNKIDSILKNYRKKLETTKSIGQIGFQEQKLSISNSITNRLLKIAPAAFTQFISNINVLESFIEKNDIKNFLSCSDGPWKTRLIVKLFQKYKINNTVIMNGWLGDEFQKEAKSATTTLCYGESYLKNYFKNKKDVRVTGNPLFENAYKRRKYVTPKFPPRRIMVGSSTFSPVDINYHYYDSEKYIMDIFDVLNKFKDGKNIKYEIELKLHPADPPEFYQWFLKENGYSEIKIINHGNFQKLVSGFDLLIINYSTGIFETALMGIPVIFYHPNNQILFEPFNGFKQLPTAFNKHGLEDILRKIFYDRDYAYSFTDIEVLKPFTGPVDGKVGERILDIVTSHLN